MRIPFFLLICFVTVFAACRKQAEGKHYLPVQKEDLAGNTKKIFVATKIIEDSKIKRFDSTDWQPNWTYTLYDTSYRIVFYADGTYECDDRLSETLYIDGRGYYVLDAVNGTSIQFIGLRHYRKANISLTYTSDRSAYALDMLVVDMTSNFSYQGSVILSLVK